MSNITQFPGGDDERPIEKVEKQISARNLGRAYRIIIAVAILGGLLVAYLIYENTKIYSSYSVISSTSHSGYSSVSVKEFNGNVLSYSKDGAKTTDASGKLLWNQTFDMQNPMVSLCGATAAFADYGGTVIYVQTANDSQKTINTDMPIRKIAVSDSDYVVAVLEDTDVTWIYMYDVNGSVIAYFRTTMEKSGYPIDIDISPSGELVAVSYYFVDCDNVKSSVAFYNFGSVGQNNIDNYVSGYNYSNTMVPLVRFLDDSTAFSLSSGRLTVYSGNHKPVSVSDMFINDEVLSIYYSKDAIAIIYNNRLTADKYRLELYNNMGRKLCEKTFNFDYAGVTFGYNSYALYGDRSLVLGTYSGDIRYEGTYDEPVRMVIPTLVQSKYVVVTEKEIVNVEFK